MWEGTLQEFRESFDSLSYFWKFLVSILLPCLVPYKAPFNSYLWQEPPILCFMSKLQNIISESWSDIVTWISFTNEWLSLPQAEALFLLKRKVSLFPSVHHRKILDWQENEVSRMLYWLARLYIAFFVLVSLEKLCKNDIKVRMV